MCTIIYIFLYMSQGARISMGEQLQNHLITITRIADIFKDKSVTGNYLSKCIYSVGMDNNDYINNYFMPQYYPTSRLYTPEQYANVLIKQYSQQLRVGAFFQWLCIYELLLFDFEDLLDLASFLKPGFVQTWSKEGSSFWVGSNRLCPIWNFEVWHKASSCVDFVSLKVLIPINWLINPRIFM